MASELKIEQDCKGSHELQSSFYTTEHLERTYRDSESYFSEDASPWHSENSSYGQGRYKTMVVESFIDDGDAVELSSRHAMKQLGSEVPFAGEVEDEEELTTNHVAEDDPTITDFLILFYLILFLFLIQIH